MIKKFEMEKQMTMGGKLVRNDSSMDDGQDLVGMLEQEIATIKANLHLREKEEHHAFKEKCDEYEKEIQNLREKVEAANGETQKKEQEKEELEGEVKHLKNHLQTLQSEHEQERINVMQGD